MKLQTKRGGKRLIRAIHHAERQTARLFCLRWVRGMETE
jgi:hypothetical protein